MTFEITAEYQTKVTISDLTWLPEGVYSMTRCGYVGGVGTFAVTFHLAAEDEDDATRRGHDLVAACAKILGSTASRIDQPARVYELAAVAAAT